MSYQANKWTQSELDTVSDMFKDGKSYDEIHKSKKVSRSAYAIECKLVTMVNDELSSGKSHKEVAKSFNRSKDEIKEMEAKAFEIKNKNVVTTQYTNDGGYEYKNKNIKKNLNIDELLDLSEFQHINRVVGTVVNFYENISRINKLHKDNIINDEFYNQLLEKLENFKFDKDKIIQSIDFTNYKNDNLDNDKSDNYNLDNNNLDNNNVDNDKTDNDKSDNYNLDDTKSKDKIETKSLTKSLTKKKYSKRII